MGLFDWLFRSPQFKRYEDAYALNRESLWSALEQTVKSEQNSLNPIWLVTHFTDTFAALQNKLDQWECDYEIVAAPIDANSLERDNLLSPNTLKIVLAELIPDATPNLLEVNRDKTIAMIVVERHPNLQYDERIIEFAKSLPFKVEFGYYLSLDDAVVSMIVGESTLTILRQLGLEEHELITSNMVSRRLKIALRRLVDSFTGDAKADSAIEWMEQNAGKASDS
ncbi:MAG: hypothetical protein AB8B55_09305 [Mariniblastus sp.]